MLRSKSLSLQLKVDQLLAARHPQGVWLRWYQRARIHASTFQWTQGLALLFGTCCGWLLFYVARGLSDFNQWDLLNNPANLPGLFPGNLAPVRSVLFVATLLQLAMMHWLVAYLPAWQQLQEKPLWDLDDFENEARIEDVYCRLPMSARAAVAMFCGEMPWRFSILLTQTTCVSFYVFLFLAYDGRLAVTPLLCGVFVGVLQAWLMFHLWVGIWIWQDWLLKSNTSLARCYRYWMRTRDALWIVVTIFAICTIPAGWWVWLFPLPPLILDPQHPQATFGAFSGQFYYVTMALLPTGWLNAAVESLFAGQVWLGSLGLLPLMAVAFAQWSLGWIIWPMQHLARGRLPHESEEVEVSHVNARLTEGFAFGQPDTDARWGESARKHVPATATQRRERHRLVESTMPNGGCGPFDRAGAEVARKILFAQASEQERLVGGTTAVRLPFSRYFWYIFPGILLFQLVLSRIQGRPADLFYVLGVLAVHGLFSMVPTVMFGLPEGHRSLLRLPVHADWVIALWVQSSWRWCARWLGILAFSWVPLLQWVDRVGLVGIGVRLLTVVLLMNWVVAGAIFLRSLSCWNELAMAQRSGFFDVRPTSLMREIYLTIGTLVWVATHLAVVLEIAFNASPWLIGIQLALSSICSWYLLYGLKQANLYPHEI